MPYLTKGGLDLKGGQFVTLMGAEVIYAPGNPLYSHSYIFNFGIPLKHTGFLLTTHLTDQIDLHSGVVTGINTGTDDNNDAVSFHGGISWKSKNEKVLLFGSVHYGPENDTKYRKPGFGGVDPNDDGRLIGDVVITLKPTDNLTFITDLNYGYDDGFSAEWYGVAQYVTLQVNKWLGVVVRGEVFRDDDGFAVAKFKDNDGFINVQRGELHAVPPGDVVPGADTTYTALTLGLNVKPCEPVMLRPEVRWDWASGGNKPFNDGGDNQMFTIAMDVLFKF
jgi:carbohydrate-selective porin OprB